MSSVRECCPSDPLATYCHFLGMPRAPVPADAAELEALKAAVRVLRLSGAPACRPGGDRVLLEPDSGRHGGVGVPEASEIRLQAARGPG